MYKTDRHKQSNQQTKTYIKKQKATTDINNNT